MKKLDLMEEAIGLSNYHFDHREFDPRFDSAQVLGKFQGDWADDVAQMIALSKTRSFGTRNLVEGQINVDLDNPSGEKVDYKEMIEGFFHLCEHYIRDNMKLGVLIRHLLERHKLVENTQEIVSNKIVTLLWLRFH